MTQKGEPVTRCRECDIEIDAGRACDLCGILERVASNYPYNKALPPLIGLFSRAARFVVDEIRKEKS